MGCLNSKPAEAEPTKTAVKVKESKGEFPFTRGFDRSHVD